MLKPGDEKLEKSADSQHDSCQIWFSINTVWEKGIVLVILDCCDKNTWTVGLTQQTFMSHSSGVWKVQDQGTSRFSICRGPDSWSTDGHFPTVSSHGRKGERAFCDRFYKSMNPNSWELHSHDLITSKKPHLPILSHLGFEFQHTNLGVVGEHRHQCITEVIYSLKQ